MLSGCWNAEKIGLVGRLLLIAQRLWERREKKKMQQSELLQKLNEETLRQGHANEGKAGGGGRLVSEVAAFKSISDVQPSTKDLLIQVGVPPGAN